MFLQGHYRVWQQRYGEADSDRDHQLYTKQQIRLVKRKAEERGEEFISNEVILSWNTNESEHFNSE